MEINIEGLNKLSRELKNDNKVIVLCHGSFDILHEGHLNLFKKAKESGDVLFVGIETDDYIKDKKGKNRPINNLKARMNNLLRIDLVDYLFIIPFDKTYKIYIDIYKNLKPDILVTAKDERFKNKETDAIAEDIKVVAIEDKNISSSDFV